MPPPPPHTHTHTHTYTRISAAAHPPADVSRYWDLVERHRVTQFYTAPTAIRALMRFGSAPVDKHDLSSLRVLGSVGEPINPEAWRWYHTVVGRGRCAIVDTYWQARAGSAGGDLHQHA